jgi:hypothetical protein
MKETGLSWPVPGQGCSNVTKPPPGTLDLIHKNETAGQYSSLKKRFTDSLEEIIPVQPPSF